MKISGKHYRTIWPREDGGVEIIDQTKLPHRFETAVLRNVQDAAHAIKAMIVRGAPLIGATAAYGMALAMREDASDEALDRAHDLLARDTSHGRQSPLGAGAHARSSCAIVRAKSAPGSRGLKPPLSPTKTSRPAVPSASTA